MTYSVYNLYSDTRDRYYIGHTVDLSRRLIQHNSGYSSSTKSGTPWKLVYTEKYDTRSEAMKREHAIKSKKSRNYIEELINQK